MRGGEHRRDERAELERLLAQLRGGQVVRRPPAELAAEEGHGAAEHVQRVAVADHLREQSGEGRGKLAQGGRARGELGRPAPAGQLAAREEAPDVLQAASGRQVERRVAAVVEEALRAPDVADLGLGDDNAVQAGRRHHRRRTRHRDLPRPAHDRSSRGPLGPLGLTPIMRRAGAGCKR